MPFNQILVSNLSNLLERVDVDVLVFIGIELEILAPRTAILLSILSSLSHWTMGVTHLSCFMTMCISVQGKEIRYIQMQAFNFYIREGHV